MPNKTLGSMDADSKSIKAIGSYFYEDKKEICHYTDLNGLKGIVENNEIWLSDHRFLNDISEHSYGKTLAIKIIKTAIKKEEGVFLETLNNLLYDITHQAPVFYVASMSLACDRLDQWKGYGQSDDSVCLVFENNIHLGQIPALVSKKIFYNRNDQKERIKKVLSIFKNEMISNPCEVSDAFSLWRTSLLGAVAREFMQFKHSQYSSEEEVRIVVSERLLKGNLKHRVSRGRIIPYTSTKSIINNSNRYFDKNTKLPLKKVIVSPTSTQDSIIKSISIFLKNTGYSDVKVLKSSIPFRG